MAIKTTVYERIEQLRLRTKVNEQGEVDPKGRVLGMTEFCLWLGMSGGWLSALKTRSKTDPTKTIDAPTAARIADKTGANETWILRAEGEPMRVADRYPERLEALKEYSDLPPDVRAEILSMRFHSGARPSKSRWQAYIDATLSAAARGERLGRPLSDDDDTPPAGRS